MVILQSEGDANTMEKGRRTEVPLAAVPPPKCIAGGSSDTHNNHNNGISRVTRGPPPRIGTAYRTAHVSPSSATTSQAGEPSRLVVFPRLYAGATTQPDCGPSGFRSEFSRRALTAQRVRPRCTRARIARGGVKRPSSSRTHTHTNIPTRVAVPLNLDHPSQCRSTERRIPIYLRIGRIPIDRSGKKSGRIEHDRWKLAKLYR